MLSFEFHKILRKAVKHLKTATSINCLADINLENMYTIYTAHSFHLIFISKKKQCFSENNTSACTDHFCDIIYPVFQFASGILICICNDLDGHYQFANHFMEKIIFILYIFCVYVLVFPQTHLFSNMKPTFQCKREKKRDTA